MKQKIFKFPTHKQLRKRSESSQCSSQEENLFASAIPADCCYKCKDQFVDENDRKKGVPMVCTYLEKCPYNHQPIHRGCFERLEEENYRYLKNCGRKTAKWTESQFQKKMWKKAGLRLLKRRLRCPCNHGFLCKDHDAYIEMKMLEEEDGLTMDSDEYTDEPIMIEDIKVPLEETKKALVEQLFDPFEHTAPEPAKAITDGDASYETVTATDDAAPARKNIFEMFTTYKKKIFKA